MYEGGICLLCQTEDKEWNWNSLVPVNSGFLLEVFLEVLKGRLELLWVTVECIVRCWLTNAGKLGSKTIMMGFRKRLEELH